MKNDFFVLREVDRNLDELTGLKHEKWEIEKRLRRLKFEKYNNTNSNPNVKKIATLIREKDLNSSDNESPDETDDETSMNTDPATTTADDQDIETLDETKIDDLDKRLALVTRKYLLIKRRVIEKQCRTRALHLGQDRYRRRYWYFSHLPGIYIEGLTSGDISADDIQNTVENVTKQRFDNKPLIPANECTSSSRAAQRKKQQARPSVSVNPTEQIIPVESNKISDNEEEKQQNNVTEDMATMDLSAFCMAVNRENEAPMVVEEKPIINGYDEILIRRVLTGCCFFIIILEHRWKLKSKVNRMKKLLMKIFHLIFLVRNLNVHLTKIIGHHNILKLYIH